MADLGSCTRGSVRRRGRGAAEEISAARDKAVRHLPTEHQDAAHHEQPAGELEDEREVHPREWQGAGSRSLSR